MLDYESRRRFAIGERFRPIISQKMCTAVSTADATDPTAACLASKGGKTAKSPERPAFDLGVHNRPIAGCDDYFL